MKFDIHENVETRENQKRAANTITKATSLAQYFTDM